MSKRHRFLPTSKYCDTLQHTAPHCTTLQHTASHCITLHHTATYSTTLHHTAIHCSTLQSNINQTAPTATHCNTLQHTATHCNTGDTDRCQQANRWQSAVRRRHGLCVAVCCSVLQCVAVCCSVLRCVAVCCSVWVYHLIPHTYHPSTHMNFSKVISHKLQVSSRQRGVSMVCRWIPHT